jgi:hypothetical protein
MTYDDAKDNCMANGGVLATFKSADIMDGVYERFYEENVANFGIFFGLSDSVSEETWLLSDGTEPIFTDWAAAHPKNRVSHNCAGLYGNQGRLTIFIYI